MRETHDVNATRNSDLFPTIHIKSSAHLRTIRFRIRGQIYRCGLIKRQDINLSFAQKDQGLSGLCSATFVISGICHQPSIFTDFEDWENTIRPVIGSMMLPVASVDRACALLIGCRAVPV